MTRLLSPLFALALLAGSALAQAPKQPAPKLPDGTQTEKDLEYGPHERNKLDLYVPKSDKPLPLVIWVHGGGWTGGDKSSGAAGAAFLVPKGYAVAAVNYRFSQQAVFPAQIADVRAAVRYLRSHAKKYNLDPDHFGAWGASAGGHLVALLGTAADVKELDGDYKSSDVSPKVQAVIYWYGAADLTSIVPPDAAGNAVAKLLGGPVGEKKELAKLASPALHATKDDAPTLIFHGDKDPLVPLKQSEILADALKKAGVECELVVIKGAGHGGKEFTSAENREKIEAFFDKHLKK